MTLVQAVNKAIADNTYLINDYVKYGDESAVSFLAGWALASHRNAVDYDGVINSLDEYKNEIRNQLLSIERIYQSEHEKFNIILKDVE